MELERRSSSKRETQGYIERFRRFEKMGPTLFTSMQMQLIVNSCVLNPRADSQLHSPRMTVLTMRKSQSETMESGSFGILTILKIQFGGGQESSLRWLLIRTLGHGLSDSSKRKVQHPLEHVKVEYPQFEHLSRHNSPLCPHSTLLSSVVTPYLPSGFDVADSNDLSTSFYRLPCVF